VETRELESAPALGPLYAKATFGALPIPGGSEELPKHAYALSDLHVDVDDLADYCRVCGFTLRETLPPTYPHLLGFPLAMKLMTERSFPFALLGLIHVANRIEQRVPISVEASPQVRVWAENLRPHHKGRQLDLVTEMAIDGDVVWLEHSTYLRPGEGDGQRPERDDDPLAEAEQVALWNVPGDTGRRYAGVSGDRNPIHLHSLSAKAFGFPSAIAHGMWTYARAIAWLDGRLAASHRSEIEFRAPLRIPGRARLRAANEKAGCRLGLESLDGEHRHLELVVRD
jgi:acyl dehydratase